MTELANVSRRGFLIGGSLALGGLALGFGARRAAAAPAGPRGLAGFLHVAADGTVTIALDKCEMGQGAQTGMAMLVAEELEVPWSAVRVVLPAEEGELHYLVTGASASLRSAWEPLRRAAAAAREMLVAAGAARLGVPVGQCRAREGRVVHEGTRRALGYAELADAAAALPLPAQPRLKPREEFALIGTSAPRLDVPSKVDGSAVYGADVRLPGMLYAALRAGATCGGALLGFDEAAARAVRGVRAVVPLENALAVVAEQRWQAERGLAAAAPRFDEGTFESAAYSRRLAEALDGAGVTSRALGDAPGVLAGAGRVVRARYAVPFLAHATLEPMTCTARAGANDCEVWVPTQAQGGARAAAAAALGIPVERVRLHTTQLGGAFGRRLESDFVDQAVRIARAAGAPVQLLWTRDEDLRHDFYRPAYAAELAAALDERGRPIAWSHHVAGPSLDARDAPEWLQSAVGSAQRALDGGLVPGFVPGRIRNRLPWWITNPVNGAAVEGAEAERYPVPHRRISYSLVECPVPVGFWRSVGHSQNAFFVESFVDELAHAAGEDPVRYRRALLAGRPRELAVLDAAAARSGWGGALSAGRARGVALHESFDTIVCQVAEISVADGMPRVERVVAAVDCGVAVNPDQVAAQIEGSIVFGLSAALRGAITFERGSARQSGFNDYPLVGLADCPEIEVHLVASDGPIGGAGEPGTPPIAPAVANALFAATGRRARTLPFSSEAA